MKRTTQFATCLAILAAVILCSGADSAPQFLVMQSVTPEEFRADHPFPPIHGPVYLRTEATGLGSYTGSFSVPDANWTCSLVLLVDKGWRGPSTSLTLTLNGTVLPIDAASLAPGECYATPIEPLVGNNALSIAMQAAPEAYLQFYIIASHQNRASAVVTPSGGSVSLPGIATVVLPPGAFAQAQSVTIGTSTSTWMTEQIVALQTVFRAMFVSPYQVCINTGTSPPDSSALLAMTCPPQLLQAAGDTLAPFAFVRIVQLNGDEFLDAYEIFQCSFSADTNTLSVSVPAIFFAKYPGLEGAYIADVLLGLAPGFLRPGDTKSIRLQTALRTCPDIQFLPPLDSMTIAPESPGYPGGGWHTPRRSDDHYYPHYAIDALATINTPVYSMAAGRVVRMEEISGGYGLKIEIAHQMFLGVPVVTTLYAHLLATEVSIGEWVEAHTEIGRTGISGYEHLYPAIDPAHLHFELRDYSAMWPEWDPTKNGQLAARNPWSCLYGFPHLSVDPPEVQLTWIRSFPVPPVAHIQIANTGEQTQALEWYIEPIGNAYVMADPTWGQSNSAAVSVMPSANANSLPGGPCWLGGAAYTDILTITSNNADIASIGVPVSLNIVDGEIIAGCAFVNPDTGYPDTDPIRPNREYAVCVDLALCEYAVFCHNALTAEYFAGNTSLGNGTLYASDWGWRGVSPGRYTTKNQYPEQVCGVSAKIYVDGEYWMTAGDERYPERIPYDWEQAVCGDWDAGGRYSHTVNYTDDCSSSGSVDCRISISGRICPAQYATDGSTWETFCAVTDDSRAHLSATKTISGSIECPPCSDSMTIAMECEHCMSDDDDSWDTCGLSLYWPNYNRQSLAMVDSFRISTCGGASGCWEPFDYEGFLCGHGSVIPIGCAHGTWINKRTGTRVYDGGPGYGLVTCTTSMNRGADGNDYPRIDYSSEYDVAEGGTESSIHAEGWFIRLGPEIEGSAGATLSEEREEEVGLVGGESGIIGVFPNPGNPGVEVSYEVESSAHVVVSVYDIRGGLVKRLVDGELGRGKYRVVWGGKDEHGGSVAAGVYLCEMKYGESRDVRKVVIVK